MNPSSKNTKPKKKSNKTTKQQSQSPFSHVNAIYAKTPFEGDYGYVQFIINKELSKNGTLIELINTVQKYSLPNKIHFKVLQSFFSRSLRPGFKQFPWIWKSQTKGHEDVELLALHYNESFDHAEQYYNLLMVTPEGKTFIKLLRTMYGKENKIK